MQVVKSFNLIFTFQQKQFYAETEIDKRNVILI